MTTTETKSRRDQDIAAALEIDGWLSQNEAAVLYDLASRARGPIVEIGSYRGRSTRALALGSMAGTKQTVYAVDSFEGAKPHERPTDEGRTHEQRECSPAILRANLDACGINGQVKIVPKPSAEALADVPQDIDLLFIDGAHEYEAVCRDMDNYLPRVRQGGLVVFHDVSPMDMGVVQAFDTKITAEPLHWKICERVDTAMVVRKRDTESFNVALGCPGKAFVWGAVKGILEASLGTHQVQALNNGNGWDDFNAIWAKALNLYEDGEITHFAMLHSDVVPEPGWLDTLLDELQALKADLVSTAIPLKDKRGLTSCGIGDANNRWGAFRRFTMRELMEMPPTFALKDTPHPDKVLLHNTGCWVCDLRNPLFLETNEDGTLKAFFDFPTRVCRNKYGKWVHGRESEDWFFSLKLHELKARTFITRKVRLSHIGDAGFRNDEAWGEYLNGDEDTADLWRTTLTEKGE